MASKNTIILYEEHGMVNKGNQWIKSEEYQREVAIDSVSIRIKLFHLPVNYIAIEKISGIN